MGLPLQRGRNRGQRLKCAFDADRRWIQDIDGRGNVLRGRRFNQGRYSNSGEKEVGSWEREDQLQQVLSHIFDTPSY